MHSLRRVVSGTADTFISICQFQMFVRQARSAHGTDTDCAPWYKVDADDKRSARLNCITHLLSMIPYREIPFELPPIPKRKKRGKDVPDSLTFKRQVPAIY